MAELIDKQAVLDILKFKPIDDGGVVDDCIMQVLALAKSKVNKLPAVDAVEVVRCGDCKHWENYRCQNVNGAYGQTILNPNWFCRAGKRREENAAD